MNTTTATFTVNGSEPDLLELAEKYGGTVERTGVTWRLTITVEVDDPEAFLARVREQLQDISGKIAERRSR